MVGEMAIRALGFDVFGTVVDWRTSIAHEVAPVLAQLGRDDVGPEAFAMAWRSRYNPAMEEVRSGRRPFVVLDVLHRETLEATLREFAIDPAAVGDERLAELNLAWHRLDPWPDSAAGLARLRDRYPVVSLSNGNVALMVDLSRYGGLTWDAILGAEHARAYKPDAAAYLRTAEALALRPDELCLVAAHHADLRAARACGLATAFVARPHEYGGAPAPDHHMGQDWEYSATSLLDLADQLGG
jgi:2-haloacid dehalogenase